MKRHFPICLLVPLLWLTSCSPKLSLTLHDEDAAALVASNFLHTAFYQHKPDDAYDATHPDFKAGATKTNFTAGIQKLQASGSPTNFIITDFSTWGTKELVGIYGNCQTSGGGVMHFRCLLIGTKRKGYGMGRFDGSTTLPQKTGMNVPFKAPITLRPAQQDGPVHSENDSWVVHRGGDVVEKKARTGVASLNTWERLVYCLWVTDYMMRNAGDFANAEVMYPDFQSDAKRFAKQLSLPVTCEAFSLSQKHLQREYFQRFQAICNELKNAEPSASPNGGPAQPLGDSGVSGGSHR